jgi:hypothetical protein
MKRIVPIYVRLASLLISIGITTLLIGIHAADLTTLGAPDTAAAAHVAATTSSAGSRYPTTVAYSPVH